MQQWPVSPVYFWEKTPFFRILIPFIAGIICYDQFIFFSRIPVLTTAAAAAFTTALLFVPQKKMSIPLRKTFHAAAIYFAFFFLGLLLSSLHDDRTKSNWFAPQIAAATAWQVQVIAPPQEKEKTWKLKVAIQHAIVGDSIKTVAGKALLYLYKNDSFTIREHDLLIIPNHLQPIKNAGNPFEMDYAHSAARDNFYYQQFLSLQDLIVLPSHSPPGLLTCIHQFSLTQLTRYIKDKPTLTLLQAMLVGEDNVLDDELRQAYSQIGIIHIVSISGSHVALFFYIICVLFAWLRHKKYTALKYLLAIIPVWIYVLMAGGASSAIRAAVMFSILTAGVVLQRDHNPLNTLLAAAFILLAIKPAWLFSVGFQLSFLAVLSLIVFYSPISKLVRPSNQILLWLWNASAASIAAELLVAPLVLYYFHSFPVMFLLANIVASVCMSVLLIAGIVLIAVCWIAPLAKLIASCCILITLVFNKIIFVLQTWSPARFNHFQFTATEIVLLYFIIAGSAVWLLLQKQRSFIVALMGSCVFISFLIVDKWQTLHQQLLIVYNTGKKQNAAYISGPAYTVLLGSDSAKEHFSVQQAQTGYHVTSKKTFSSEAFFFRTKKVLVLKAKPKGMKPFPVDILIIAVPLKEIYFPDVQAVFSPRQIVLSSGQSTRRATAWRDSCNMHKIAFHNPAEDGAYISR